MTTQLVENKCDGGEWSCTPPKECCKQGCCFLFSSSIFKGSSATPSFQSGSVFNPLFLGHWYFWLAVTATVAGILCACSLWRKHHQGSLCCRESSRDERISEPDSNGSCYAPPQYSRCGSFHQAPPPYSEVAAKPDLYPLVISYNAEPVIKNSNGSTGYLMVQYFRNFIVRPVGTLSATSTIDSLSSSFLCNAANEANSMIPPPYSHMGSLEEITTDCGPQSQNESQQTDNRSPSQTAQQPTPSPDQRTMSRSVSSNSQQEYQQVLHTSSSAHTPLCSSQSGNIVLAPLPGVRSTPVTPRPHNPVVSITNNPCFGTAQPNTQPQKLVTTTSQDSNTSVHIPVTSHRTKRTLQEQRRKISKEDSESQEDENNFSDLLNLSVCMPGVIERMDTVNSQEFQFSVTNSIGSDISSLANLGSPGSPPRATSPTAEMRHLLDKIQQLPQQKSPQMHPEKEKEKPISRGCFHKIRAKTMYMPLNSGDGAKSRSVFSRSWLSRSAPCTPSGAPPPSFPAHHHQYHKAGTSKPAMGGAKSNSRTNLKARNMKGGDSSPLLLREHAEESEEEARQRDERL
ncbi:unnamed protein product [Acanthoscelides obtectus]|uniref:WW domain binding protein VOPP1 n=1 Tax=Acanthoscelides obtectus TaxID=200917 RepID=A0A9P0Q267_ACAOB|nr:unnamed protein product [Acanthoscelides obtectus]CAK1619917.1 hypothetical protein AOBTE_LOCUS74 [Acanthoscelides obtectus]